jgi:carbon starvation protein
MFTEELAGRTVMHAMPIMLGVLCILAIAYRYYSAFLAAKVACLDDSRITPAHQFEDGQNYDPTNKWVLFGHHFAAISGAGPLIGPVLAIQYGYMPGLLWLVIGVCLAGAVQDMLVLAASVRRGGKSLAEIARTELGSFASGVVSLAILFIVVIALAGLAFVVVKALGGEEVKVPAGLEITVPSESFSPTTEEPGYEVIHFPAGCLVRYPGTDKDSLRAEPFRIRKPADAMTTIVYVNLVWPDGVARRSHDYSLPGGCEILVPGSSWGTFTIAATIPIALFVGFYMYRIKKGAVVQASLIGAALTLGAVFVGSWVPGSPWEHWFSLNKGQTTLALCIYGFVASVLPVWMLLCPRDYLSSFLKIGTIVLLVAGVLIANPVLQCPPINEQFSGGGPTFPWGGIFPFVFICIMCGAISGFHALVSSGTTPKMIDKESQVRMIGYGAMLIEGLVGVVALIAAASLDPKLYYDINVAQDEKVIAKWQPRLDALYRELGDGSLSHLPVERRDLGRVEELVGGESLRGRTGGAVTLAVGMSFILSDAAKWFVDPDSMHRFLKYWYHFAIMFEALFILTTIDAGTRIGRFLVQETLGKLHPQFAKADWLPGAWLATFLVTAGWGALVWTGSIDTIWPMFGIANQLLAVLALTLVTTLLVNSGRGRYAPVTLLPMIFVVSTTMTAGVRLVGWSFPAMYSAGQPLKATLCIALTVLVMACVMTLLLMAAARWVVVLGGVDVVERSPPQTPGRG